MTVVSDDRAVTSLSAWGRAIDRAISAGELEFAARQARVVLTHLPRHLVTYQRLLEICWQTESWSEGEDWARRLLQADPGNSTAWRTLAQAAEVRDQRRHANTIWRRAFEMNPYDPEIRAGLSRTNLESPNALTYNLACLASLYLRGRRWEHAAESYGKLIEADSRRVDFQICLAVAQWQAGEREEAYALARHLVNRHPHFLMAWMVLRETGDENDRALAASPIETMDPDGEYAASMWGAGKPVHSATILTSQDEATLLEYRLAQRQA